MVKILEPISTVSVKHRHILPIISFAELAYTHGDVRIGCNSNATEMKLQ